jgi:hypothetical protein
MFQSFKLNFQKTQFTMSVGVMIIKDPEDKKGLDSVHFPNIIFHDPDERFQAMPSSSEEIF